MSGTVLGGLSVAAIPLLSDSAPASAAATQAAQRSRAPAKSPEPIIEPAWAIVDPHHHLWFTPAAELAKMSKPEDIFSRDLAPAFRSHSRYLLDEFLADADSGHNIQATVFLEAGAMYRAGGPESMKAVGEVEFANGVAAMAASGLFGKTKVCAGIVGNADLTLGDAVQDVLHAHIQAGDGRYRGVRNSVAHDPDRSILGPYGKPHMLLDSQFRKGASWLHKLGLSFDVFMLGPQLGELIDFARAFPDTQIILNHVGVPVLVASYAIRVDEALAMWRDNIRTLSRCQNVAVKLSGLGSTSLQGFKSFRATPPWSSERLAAEWKPYIEWCIEAFGADRCMFASDFPPGSSTCSYPVLWNAFKRLAAGASKAEQTALFSGTATRVYRLNTSDG